MFKEGDLVKFEDSELCAKGFLCEQEDYGNSWVVKVIPLSMVWGRLRLELHDCNGYFKEPVGWFVNEKNMELTSFTLDEILGLYV